MMMHRQVKGHRVASVVLLLVGGVAVSVATWTGGDHGWAIGSIVLYLVLAGVVYLWAGRSGDIAAILRAGGDERQRSIDRDAWMLAGVAMTLVAMIGAIVELGRTGNPGVYGLFCAVEGIVYAASVAVLRWRR
jgi:hypothetical protein